MCCLFKAAEKERTRSLGKASLGGPFSLMDHNGNPKTDKDYLGQWILVYFGFTFCPDICPDELEKLTKAINKLGNNHTRPLSSTDISPPDDMPSLPKLHPLFITVDPARDTPKVLKSYLKG